MTWTTKDIHHYAWVGPWELHLMAPDGKIRWEVTYTEDGTVIVASGHCQDANEVRAAAIAGLHEWLCEQYRMARARVVGWRPVGSMGGRKAYCGAFRLEVTWDGFWNVWLDGEDDLGCIASGLPEPDAKATRAAMLKAWRAWLRGQVLVVEGLTGDTPGCKVSP
mgnify:CR=1 FL=1